MRGALTLSLSFQAIGLGSALPSSFLGENDDALLPVQIPPSNFPNASVGHGSLETRNGPMPRFQASGKWLDVSCENDDTNNLEVPFDQQWKTADGSSMFTPCFEFLLHFSDIFLSQPAAWDQAMKAFKADKNPAHLSFDAWLSNAFYSAQVPRCGILDASTKCSMRDCDPMLRPAGALMMDSLVGLNVVSSSCDSQQQQR